MVCENNVVIMNYCWSDALSRNSAKAEKTPKQLNDCFATCMKKKHQEFRLSIYVLLRSMSEVNRPWCTAQAMSEVNRPWYTAQAMSEVNTAPWRGLVH